MNLLELKYDRLSEPERFLLDIFDGLEVYNSEKYPSNILYKKNNIVMFEYDQNRQIFWYSMRYIREVFCGVFEFNDQETSDLVKYMVEKYIKLKIIVIGWGEFTDNSRW